MRPPALAGAEDAVPDLPQISDELLDVLAGDHRLGARRSFGIQQMDVNGAAFRTFAEAELDIDRIEELFGHAGTLRARRFQACVAFDLAFSSLQSASQTIGPCAKQSLQTNCHDDKSIRSTKPLVDLQNGQRLAWAILIARPPAVDMRLAARRLGGLKADGL
jgi:hypothetical protein